MNNKTYILVISKSLALLKTSSSFDYKILNGEHFDVLPMHIAFGNLPFFKTHYFLTNTNFVWPCTFELNDYYQRKKKSRKKLEKPTDRNAFIIIKNAEDIHPNNKSNNVLSQKCN